MKSISIGRGLSGWISGTWTAPPFHSSAGRGSGKPFLLFVCNFTPVPRLNYRVGVPDPGLYREIFNSDAEMFGGSNLGNAGAVMSEPVSTEQPLPQHFDYAAAAGGGGV